MKNHNIGLRSETGKLRGLFTKLLSLSPSPETLAYHRFFARSLRPRRRRLLAPSLPLSAAAATTAATPYSCHRGPSSGGGEAMPTGFGSHDLPVGGSGHPEARAGHRRLIGSVDDGNFSTAASSTGKDFAPHPIFFFPLSPSLLQIQGRWIY